MREDRVYDKLETMMAMANRAARLFDAVRAEGKARGGETITTAELALERALYLAIQDLLDIAAMLAASIGPNPAMTYRETIEILGGAGALPSEAVPGLRQMTGFRNILAHEYGDLDRDRLLGFEPHMDDFETFARCVVAYLHEVEA